MSNDKIVNRYSKRMFEIMKEMFQNMENDQLK